MASDHQQSGDLPPRHVRRVPFVLFAMGSVLFLLEGLRTKIVPGGPFVSILGEALPIIFFTATIVSSVCELRYANAWMKLMLWLMSMHSAAGIGLLIDGIIRFWFRPYARGDLLGL